MNGMAGDLANAVATTPIRGGQKSATHLARNDTSSGIRQRLIWHSCALIWHIEIAGFWLQKYMQVSYM